MLLYVGATPICIAAARARVHFWPPCSVSVICVCLLLCQNHAGFVEFLLEHSCFTVFLLYSKVSRLYAYI